MDNLQRSVSKFFDSRRKLQKRQRAAAAAEAAASEEVHNNQQLNQDQKPIVSNVSAYQPSIDNQAAPKIEDTLSKSTGAIKKQPSIKLENEKHHYKLGFFCRNNSIYKSRQPQQQSKLPPTTTTEHLSQRFPRMQASSSTLKSLDKGDASLEGICRTPNPNIRSAHFALTQLRSLDGHLGLGSQIHESPEEPTPPEFAYQHLGSLPTTNSNTSLESSFCESGETSTTNTKTTSSVTTSNATASSVCYWAWQQTIATVANTNTRDANDNNNNNNNDLFTLKTTTTTTNNYNITRPAAATTGGTKPLKRFDLNTDTLTTKRATTTTYVAGTDTSKTRTRRSPLLKMPVIKQLSTQPSTTEEHEETILSTTVKTTATSKPPSRSGSASKLMNFLFKSSNESCKSLHGQSNEGFTASSYGSSSGEWEYLGAVNSIGHTRMDIESLLSSPNNPFLPEIVARSYNSTYNSQEFEFPPTTSCEMHTHSQLPTPAYSRAGSQESTHSEGTVPLASDNISPVSRSSRAGRQRRKLFSLHSPRFVQQRQQEPEAILPVTTPLLGVESVTAPSGTTSEHGSFIRNLNPFLSSSRRASSHGIFSKHGSQRQVSTPATMPADLCTKREEFLRATMKICLVVSPPNTKLQIKSKSLTHLDGLNSTATYQHGDKSANATLPFSQNIVGGENINFTTPIAVAAGRLNRMGARARPPRFLSSASTEESSEPGPSSSSGGKVKHRWSSLFGVRNAEYGQLCDILNTFSRTGVPQQPETILFLEHPNFADAMQYLSNMHNSWTDFIDCKNMSENDKKIQTAIWELVTTEVYYIQSLQTVTNLFLACLLSVQEYNILNDVDQNKLFSNVREICFANLRFWTMSLYPMVAHSVATREPMRIVFFQQGFASFGALFAPYKRYCAEQSTCQYYCKELYRNNVLFTSYLAWCESHKMCNRLRLADILVRPMQRLTKYSLLLSAIRKQLYSIHEVELVDFMIQSVENFVCSVNTHLTIRQEHERLKGVMARIESYDVVPETNNDHLDRMVKQFSRMFDLCMPMMGCSAHHVRHLFMEGDHKYKDETGKHDVHCFLMTDMLIVCKATSKRTVGQLKVIRQPYKTDRLVVHLQNNMLSCVYLNEYQVAVSAFTLTCLEARSWYDSLQRARNIYTRLKQSVLNMASSNAPPGMTTANYTSELASHGPPYAYTQIVKNNNGAVVPNDTLPGSRLVATETSTDNIVSGAFDSSLAVSNADPHSMLLRQSPLTSSSVCSHISSTNASKSGSVEWNESRNISVEMEKTNSLSSDDGATTTGTHGVMAALLKGKNFLPGHINKPPTKMSSSSLNLQPPVSGHLGQSLPNLTIHPSNNNNTLLVPGTSSIHSGNLLLSPSHRGISYPPPSPTRVPLRRGFAFTTSLKNPPLVKTRNITSQNSFTGRHRLSSSVPVATCVAATIPATTEIPQEIQQTSYVFSTNSEGTTGAPKTNADSSKLAAVPLLLTNDDIVEESAEHSMHK